MNWTVFIILFTFLGCVKSSWSNNPLQTDSKDFDIILMKHWEISPEMVKKLKIKVISIDYKINSDEPRVNNISFTFDSLGRFVKSIDVHHSLLIDKSKDTSIEIRFIQYQKDTVHSALSIYFEDTTNVTSHFTKTSRDSILEYPKNGMYKADGLRWIYKFQNNGLISYSDISFKRSFLGWRNKGHGYRIYSYKYW